MVVPIMLLVSHAYSYTDLRFKWNLTPQSQHRIHTPHFVTRYLYKGRVKHMAFGLWLTQVAYGRSGKTRRELKLAKSRASDEVTDLLNA